jgi:flagellar biosynthesis protein FlhA
MGRRNKVKLKRNDLFIGIYILSAVLFFIISIPSWLLDILLAFNIMVALVILFNSLFAKEVLDMASFPTMLLFTTIFRISLNVSSTKMILRDGYAGHVVSDFLSLIFFCLCHLLDSCLACLIL